MNMDRRCADLFDAADDLKLRAEPRGPAVADVDVGHEISRSVPAKHRTLVDSYGAEHVRAGALNELQIICIVDDARRVRVLEIDGKREAVLRADEAAAVRQVEVRTRHRPCSSEPSPPVNPA